MTAPPPKDDAPRAQKDLTLNLVLSGDPLALKDVFVACLREAAWTVELDQTDWAGRATKGSQALNLLFGALAQYHEVQFALHSLPGGGTSLTLWRVGNGCLGGVIGMHRVKVSFRDTARFVEDHFRSQGCVVE